MWQVATGEVFDCVKADDSSGGHLNLEVWSQIDTRNEDSCYSRQDTTYICVYARYCHNFFASKTSDCAKKLGEINFHSRGCP